MYKTILVPVDNSEYSNQAVASALALGRSFESKLVGCHVYAAKMHDYRFKQMEYTLPDEYLEETELDRQRKIHDSLITMGLQLISDSYLEQMRRACAEGGIAFEPRMMDGKHHEEILRDIEAQAYDLTILGVLGLGRSRDSQIGSVCERVARQAASDVWVVKRREANGHDRRETILVGIDGSPQSFGALLTAIELAQRFGKRIEAIAVYDPYLHYSVFNGVVNVLTEKAAKVFRFEEQNQLHEEIIDTGLAQIYQSHLDVAERIAADRGVAIRKTLLDGKAFQKVLNHARETEPWLLVLGRIGVHSAPDAQGLGSNAENLLRLCPCDVLLTTRLERPELDLKAEESIRWTPEALERMKRVPDQVRGIARTAIYRLAVEKGHSVITSDVLDDAMERYMPKGAAARTRALAGQIALEAAREGRIAVCKKCGVASGEPDPVKCGVCGGDTWHVITSEMLERIAEIEGGLAEEATYDGRKLKWTQEAKRALWTMKDAYQRRRAKARVEKSARVKRLNLVTLEFAARVIEEETGIPLELPAGGAEAAPEVPLPEDAERRLVARDDKNVPLLSELTWSDDAVARVLRVPAGFMRDRTQRRIEELAAERGTRSVDLELVESGIAHGRKMMEEMIRTQSQAARPRGEEPAAGSDEAPRNGGGNGARRPTHPLNEAGIHANLMSRAAKDEPDGPA